MKECREDEPTQAETRRGVRVSETPRGQCDMYTERAKTLLLVCQHFELQNTESVTQSYNLEVNSIKRCTKESSATPDSTLYPRLYEGVNPRQKRGFLAQLQPFCLALLLLFWGIKKIKINAAQFCSSGAKLCSK